MVLDYHLRKTRYHSSAWKVRVAIVTQVSGTLLARNSTLWNLFEEACDLIRPGTDSKLYLRLVNHVEYLLFVFIVASGTLQRLKGYCNLYKSSQETGPR